MAPNWRWWTIFLWRHLAPCKRLLHFSWHSTASVPVSNIFHGPTWTLYQSIVWVLCLAILNLCHSATTFILKITFIKFKVGVDVSEPVHSAIHWDSHVHSAGFRSGSMVAHEDFPGIPFTSWVPNLPPLQIIGLAAPLLSAAVIGYRVESIRFSGYSSICTRLCARLVCSFVYWRKCPANCRSCSRNCHSALSQYRPVISIGSLLFLAHFPIVLQLDIQSFAIVYWEAENCSAFFPRIPASALRPILVVVFPRNHQMNSRDFSRNRFISVLFSSGEAYVFKVTSVE